MILTFEDFKNKFKPLTNNNGKIKFFSANDEEVRNKRNLKMVWNIEKINNTIIKIVPNCKEYITFGLHIVTEHAFTQNHEETLKVIGSIY